MNLEPFPVKVRIIERPLYLLWPDEYFGWSSPQKHILAVPKQLH